MFKKLSVATALLAMTAFPSIAQDFWVIGKPYTLYYDTNVKLAAQAFGRLIEVNEAAGYVVMDNNSVKPIFQSTDVLLDGNTTRPYPDGMPHPILRFPPAKEVWWSLKDVAYVGPLDKLP